MFRYTRDGTRMLASFDYAPDVIQSLKAAIPSRCRRWDPEARVWSIDIRWWESACRVFEMYGLMQGLRTPDTAWEALHLRSSAPPELVDAAYRTLAKVHHPDHGGDNAKMRDLNLAYEKLRGNQ